MRSVHVHSAALVAALIAARSAAAQRTPSLEDVVGLRSVGAPAIAPDGRAIAYPVSGADWAANRTDTEIWIARDGEAPFQLTRTEQGSSDTPRWSPDGQWLAFLADRGDGRQLHLIRASGGEARKLTTIKGGLTDYRWAPDGRSIALAAGEPETDNAKARKERYGEFTIENVDVQRVHLWLLDLPPDILGAPAAPACRDSVTGRDSAGGPGSCAPTSKLRRLTGGDTITVGSFNWSPDGRQIAFAHRPDPLLSSGQRADIAVVDVTTGRQRPLVISRGPDDAPVWSPDGRWILFETTPSDTGSYYKNGYLAKVPSSGGDVTLLTQGFDEEVSSAVWTPDGIRFLADRGTKRQLFSLDPATGRVSLFADSPAVITAASFSADGKRVALRGESATSLAEIYRTAARPFAPVAVTSMTAQTSGWRVGTREVISWKSQDGATIEGVLYKPSDYQPGRRYPLFVVIHGGPTGTSRPVLLEGSVYPVLQWLAKGAVVLMPNYRGSAGYGEKFRSLNVRNLGVGDAWDVLSGVDTLIGRGIADSTRMAAMGWSQGGYISAFLSTTSKRFKAISVGAGISNWVTYYVSTDIHPFTREYLQATPWDDPEIYRKTSPMTYIAQASTPTLIQHGELDRRVPISNAYELFQGLQDRGVPSRLIVYKGFGHGINKPKERLAAMTHNWEWFEQYLWRVPQVSGR